ncbi:MAG: hypothetical protein J6X44_04045 [Thermoguttaceae bacterium]|nr:hypothetical protein [Thermoguttaceae bacterium]
MGFFKRKVENKKPRETNEIKNKELKERLADAALGLLTKGEDYEELNHTKVEFGYLFNVENHGLESLFKVTTDKTTAYFQTKGNKLMRLDLPEGLYQATVEQVKELHRGV